MMIRYRLFILSIILLAICMLTCRIPFEAKGSNPNIIEWITQEELGRLSGIWSDTESKFTGIKFNIHDSCSGFISIYMINLCDSNLPTLRRVNFVRVTRSNSDTIWFEDVPVTKKKQSYKMPKAKASFPNMFLVFENDKKVRLFNLDPVHRVTYTLLLADEHFIQKKKEACKELQSDSINYRDH